MTPEQEKQNLSPLEFCRVNLTRLIRSLEKVQLYGNNNHVDIARDASECVGRAKLMLDVIKSDRMQRKEDEQIYTVVMYIASHARRFTTHVKATTLDDALTKAKRQALEPLMGLFDESDIHVAAMFRGAADDITPGEM